VTQRMNSRELVAHLRAQGVWVRDIGKTFTCLNDNLLRLRIRGGHRVWQLADFEIFVEEVVSEVEMLEQVENFAPAPIANCDDTGSRSLTAESGESGREKDGTEPTENDSEVGK
jgi:hypothetical protein